MLVLAALCGFAFTACGGSAPDVVVPMYRGEPNGDDAALVGMLVVEEPCLLVEVGGGEPLLIGFPADFAKWDDENRELTLSGETFSVGERMQFGGSARPTNQATADWATKPSSDCDAGWIWMSHATARLAPVVP